MDSINVLAAAQLILVKVVELYRRICTKASQVFLPTLTQSYYQEHNLTLFRLIHK